MSPIIQYVAFIAAAALLALLAAAPALALA